MPTNAVGSASARHSPRFLMPCQFLRVSVIKYFTGVQFCVTLARGITPQCPDAPGPVGFLQHVEKVIRVGAIDAEVLDCTTGGIVHRVYRITQGLTGGQSAIRLHGKRNDDRHTSRRSASCQSDGLI